MDDSAALGILVCLGLSPFPVDTRKGDSLLANPNVDIFFSSGYLATPDQQNITLDGLTVLTHTFSQKALPPYINGYTAAVVWGYSRAFYDTHIFFQIDEANGTGEHRIRSSTDRLPLDEKKLQCTRRHTLDVPSQSQARQTFSNPHPSHTP